jgi:hypothetical protein
MTDNVRRVRRSISFAPVCARSANLQTLRNPPSFAPNR